MARETLPKVNPSYNPDKKATSSAGETQKSKAVSVYLSNKDKQALDEIAQKNNINRHMLLSYAVRYFLANYRAGHIKLDPTIEAGKVVLNISLDLTDMGA